MKKDFSLFILIYIRPKIADECLWVRSHRVKEMKDTDDGGFIGPGNMNEAMMSLPAALTVASRQGQTGQQRLVYLTVENNTSFFFCFSCSPAQTFTRGYRHKKKNTSATSDGHFRWRPSDPPLQHNSPEIQNSQISSDFKVKETRRRSKDSSGSRWRRSSGFKASSTQTQLRFRY